MKIGFAGLGEAGSRYAADAVRAGHDVVGHDPGPVPTPDGVRRVESLPELLAHAELVVVLTGASLSLTIARECAGELGAGAVYADFTTASPGVMAEAAALIEAGGAGFADVAILGPVPMKGAATDTIVSGSAAPEVAEFLRSLGSDVEHIDGAAGDATSRKLLRSVLMKSLAVVVVETLEAGRAAGCEGWVRAQIAGQLAGEGRMIDRFETGTRQHALRRAHEMSSVVEYLTELAVPAEMSDASRRTLERIAEQSHA
ncbi:NAD(P)-dependent oxidoreductase [Prauserella cavernicola]|uniref:NAD(P)-dependent oxidoreductase n=1 Tax=Prauserella cavernicola TaxID=2800127 RepID=A0A934V1R4_9PSEU|nr:NAD(P)-dependent oxidoreductase [Prauserella cavernicola]MBK1783746.1 NAD(P)-dependent oxidoreductase [Prauserella cavernicola]